MPEAFYDAVLVGDYLDLTHARRLSAEFATKFVVDHLAIDDDMWRELHDNFTDDELVDLALCVGAWIASAASTACSTSTAPAASAHRSPATRARSADQRMCTPEIARAITRRWISDVPSKIV